MGMCQYYKISLYLIQPDLTIILVFGISLILFVLTLSKGLPIAIYLLKVSFKEGNEHLKIILGVNGIALIIALFILYIRQPSWYIFGIIAAVTFILNLLYWMLPLLYRIRQKTPIKDKLSSIRAIGDDNTLLDVVMDKVDHSEKKLVFSLLFIPLICYLLGDGEAIKKRISSFI